MHLGGGLLWRNIAGAVAVLGALGGAVPAFASELADTVVHIRASNFVGEGYLDVSIHDGAWDASGTRFDFSHNDPLAITSEANGEIVAYILNLNFTGRVGPLNEMIVSLGVYTVGYETDFELDTSILDFRAIAEPDARGRASATFTVTDLGGDFARLTGLGDAGAGACRALYNGHYPDASQFAQLVSFIYTSGGGTTTGTQNDPPSGYRPIGAIPSDLSLHLGFRVTPDDFAYATTRFVIPSPNSWCPGDVDADETVGVQDLGLLLAAFGAQDGEAEYLLEADLDADGMIGVSDLAILLANFGMPCP